MKNILVTGQNSYIGNSFCDYIKEFSQYTITKISVRDESWKAMDFSMYDVIFHVAGIAHSDTKRISEKQKNYIGKKSKSGGRKTIYFYQFRDCLWEQCASWKNKNNYKKYAGFSGKLLWRQ